MVCRIAGGSGRTSFNSATRASASNSGAAAIGWASRCVVRQPMRHKPRTNHSGEILRRSPVIGGAPATAIGQRARRNMRSEDLEDCFDLDGNVSGKRAHADGAAGANAVLGSEQLCEEFAAAVDDFRMIEEVGR